MEILNAAMWTRIFVAFLTCRRGQLQLLERRTDPWSLRISSSEAIFLIKSSLKCHEKVLIQLSLLL